MNAHYALRSVRSGGIHYDWLENSQLENQKLFLETCGEESMRPKHHLRLHLSEIYKELGYCDSFTCEKKHQGYKKKILPKHTQDGINKTLGN